MTLASFDWLYFGRSECRVVHAAEERFQVAAGGALVADGGEKRPSAGVVNNYAPIYSIGDLRRRPLDPVERVHVQPVKLHAVFQRCVEHRALAGDGVGRGRLSIRSHRERIEPEVERESSSGSAKRVISLDRSWEAVKAKPPPSSGGFALGCRGGAGMRRVGRVVERHAKPSHAGPSLAKP
jgi:hypothetical protein